MLYDKNFYDKFDNVIEVFQDYFFVARRRTDLDERNDVIQGN